MYNNITTLYTEKDIFNLITYVFIMLFNPLWIGMPYVLCKQYYSIIKNHWYMYGQMKQKFICIWMRDIYNRYLCINILWV